MTATICMTPVSESRCTRWRTAASERPTALPIEAYERRPSCCSCSMIDLDTSSSPTLDLAGLEGFFPFGACLLVTRVMVARAPGKA